MGTQLVEVTRRISAGYRAPHGRVDFWTFHPDRVNRIPEETLAKILAQKGADGKSALAPYMADGTLTMVSEERANAIVEGKATLAADEVDKPPAQLIAEAHAREALDLPKPRSRKRN